MLLYALHRNHLTQGDDDYSAIPQAPTARKIEDIIEQITRPGSILKETECVAVIHDFFKAIAANLSEGVGFNSEYLRISPGLSGVFNGIEDEFDPARHQREVHINAGTVLKASAESMPVKKVDAELRRPEIDSVFDIKTQQSDGIISPGHALEIHGELLKLDLEARDEVVAFIPAGNGKKEYRAAVVHDNLPKKLTVLIPEDLPAGQYRLEVRNRVMTNKRLRTGAYENVLIVK